MEASVKNEINSCIAELRSIAQALDEAASQVTSSVSGMSTRKYTDALQAYAENYRKAANKLSNIS